LGGDKIMNELYRTIKFGHINEALDIIMKSNFNDIRDTLLEVAYDTQSIIPYTIMCHLISKEEDAEFHYFASVLLSHPLCHLPGAYQSALYHTREAMKLNPKDLELKEYFISFYYNPEELITKEEACRVAKLILTLAPNNEFAKKFLSELEED
jgi:hypothetical protein